MPREESSTKTLERLFLLKFTERPPNITAGNSRPLLLCMDMSRTTLAEAICAAPRESPERAFSINRRKPRMPWPEFEYMPAFFMSASRLAYRDWPPGSADT